MKIFNCTNCGHPVYFENIFCVNCNTSLGFDSQSLQQIPWLKPMTGNTETTQIPVHRILPIAIITNILFATGWFQQIAMLYFALHAS